MGQLDPWTPNLELDTLHVISCPIADLIIRIAGPTLVHERDDTATLKYRLRGTDQWEPSKLVLWARLSS